MSRGLGDVYKRQTYMPACDGDEIVKHGFMYFSLSKSENNELRKIMKKYGADTRKAI